jgi:metabolite-proton symporter
MSTASAELPEEQRRSMLVRAVIASTIGTSIEWYDFFLYSIVTGLVFAKQFFPNQDPWVGTLNAFAIYAVGFIARPIGAAIFGHYGDRIGRKGALIATLLLMGIATFLVAFVPGYSQIGIWGAIILTVLRFVQGVGVGGEWGGSVLLAMEWTKIRGNRGFVAAWPQFGVPVGSFLANLAVLAFANALPGEHFQTWGWRVPFLFSGVLVVIGLWIRLSILETPIFSKLVAENRIEKAPAAKVLQKQWGSVILSALIRLAEQTPYYIFTAFIFAYGVQHLKIDKTFFLNAMLVFAVIEFFLIPFFGYLSDRIGRKTMYLIGAVTMMICAFLFFALLDSGNLVLIFIGAILGALPHAMVYGPQAALIAEQFTPRMRYSGASLGYQLASLIAGGPSPLIAAWLFATYKNGMVIAWYIAICALIAFIACLFMVDYSRKDVNEEYAHVGD